MTEVTYWYWPKHPSDPREREFLEHTQYADWRAAIEHELSHGGSVRQISRAVGLSPGQLTDFLDGAILHPSVEYSFEEWAKGRPYTLPMGGRIAVDILCASYPAAAGRREFRQDLLRFLADRYQERGVGRAPRWMIEIRAADLRRRAKASKRRPLP